MSAVVAIVDSGAGNVHSVAAGLVLLGYRPRLTRDPDTIRTADALVLPGVGAYGAAMATLEQRGLLPVLAEQVLGAGKPLLGICLGMQLLGHTSEESPGRAGLGWLDFEVRSMPTGGDLKVPHVGWNQLERAADVPLFHRLGDNPHFYFDHRYFAVGADELTVAWCAYGVAIPAVVVKDNVVGIQCHPEKSQTNGLRFFRNFFRAAGL